MLVLKVKSRLDCSPCKDALGFLKEKNPKPRNDFVILALRFMLFLAACGLVDTAFTKSQLTKQELV